MQIVKKIAIAIAALVVIPVLFFAISIIMEYRPDEREVIFTSDSPTPIKGDTIKMLSWNIGYCGLGEEMDFFYDGGESVQSIKERTLENLEAIKQFLKEHSDVDFILLQEVDINSKRSYHINEFEEIGKTLDQHHGYFAYNYNSIYVPIPITEAIGKVESGMVLFSKYLPSSVERLQYPSRFPFYVSPFNLKRAALKADFVFGDNTLSVVNTHNTAYDDGGMRTIEMRYIDSLASATPYGIVAGDWNSTPPGYKQSESEKTNPYFQPQEIYYSDFNSGYKFAWDSTTHSNRYLNESYKKGETTETLIDFAYLSSTIETIDVRTIDLGFKNSDHNPVELIFLVK